MPRRTSPCRACPPARRLRKNGHATASNYFSSGKVTNGTVEGLNNKIKVIKRRGYGYRNNGNFRQRILTECAG